MSASREKKARQELNESGYVDPRKAREAEEKAKERRSTRIYTAVIVAFVLLGVVLFASGRIQASNEAKETARIGAESAVTIDGEDFSVNDMAAFTTPSPTTAAPSASTAARAPASSSTPRVRPGTTTFWSPRWTT